MESKSKCTKGDACSFRHDVSKCGKKYTLIFSHFKIADRQRRESTLRKAGRPKEGVHLVKGSRNRVRIPSKELAQSIVSFLAFSRVPILQFTNRLRIWREVFVPAQGDGPTARSSPSSWLHFGLCHPQEGCLRDVLEATLATPTVVSETFQMKGYCAGCQIASNSDKHQAMKIFTRKIGDED